MIVKLYGIDIEGEECQGSGNILFSCARQKPAAEGVIGSCPEIENRWQDIFIISILL